MPNPWEENYATAEKGPWDDYAPTQEISGDIDNIIDEMHPKIDFMDRVIIKNFGGDTNNAIGYLKKRHPGLEVKASLDGEIIAREKGETEYRKLDPSSFEFQDITDVGTDVGAGLLSSAATAAGGLVGNLPGAVAAGAASSGGLEALRQGIGKALGVNDDISGTDIALSTGFGAVSPLLFGSGQSVAAATKAASGQGVLGGLRAKLAQALGQNMGSADEIMSANRGGVGRVYDAYKNSVAPKIGELTSGVSAETIKTARDQLPEITSMEKTGITSFAQSAKKEAETAVKSVKETTGKAIEEAIDQSETPVSLVSAMEPFDKLATKIEAALERRPDNKSLQTQLDSVLEAKAQFFNEGETLASTRDAWELMQDLKEITKPGKTPATSLKSSFGATATLADKRVTMAAAEASKRLKDGIETATAQHPSGGTAVLNKTYGEISKDAKQISKFFSDDDKIAQRLASLDSPANRQFLERMERFDASNNTKIVDKAKLMAAFQNFGKAPWLARSAGGTTSTSRTVPLGLAASAIGGYAGAQMGGASGAWLGAGTGGLLGATLGGPKALRFYMQSQRNLAKMAEQGKKLGLGPQATTKSIWEMMRERDKK